MNPGSVGLPAYVDPLPVRHAMEMGAPHARYAVLERRKAADPWDISFRVVPYDWNAAACAPSKGREDWAKWIKTGYAETAPPPPPYLPTLRVLAFLGRAPQRRQQRHRPAVPCGLRGAADVIWRAVAARHIGLRAVGLRARLVIEAQRQRDALARDLDLQHLHLDDVARLHDLARVLDEGLGHRRDVHQTVLMHADIDEGAEGRDVGHRAFEDHAGLEVA